MWPGPYNSELCLVSLNNPRCWCLSPVCLPVIPASKKEAFWFLYWQYLLVKSSQENSFQGNQILSFLPNLSVLRVFSGMPLIAQCVETTQPTSEWSQVSSESAHRRIGGGGTLQPAHREENGKARVELVTCFIAFIAHGQKRNLAM